jgi:hypothetical protein
MTRFLLTILFLIFEVQSSFAIDRKAVISTRTHTEPKIDGILNDTVWNKASVIHDFSQQLPLYNGNPSFRTEVRVLYDDAAIYIAAKMYDPHPDSILKQLGNRDDQNLNADYFTFALDTYNTQIDAYFFTVTASGVQMDSRKLDLTFNAVWQSAVKITSEGWTVEIKIPYSAIRFPAKEIQNWGMQLTRYIRRYRETDQWGLEEQGKLNNMLFWGQLKEISSIKAPLRLSLSPYFTAYVENYPYNQKGVNNWSSSLSGGMDLKYGLNEAFTLDMSLMPDFSQVKTDNQIKNLTAFETVYTEQRAFFKEAIDLFQRSSLFYSRRIGRTPINYDVPYENLATDEKVIKNPTAAELLNATKFSGRNASGLAIGVFNAITGDTYAEIENSAGEKRKVLTDPQTNYNIMVLDQALKHNSSMYVINTNTYRWGDYRSSNASGAGFTLYNKSNTYRLITDGEMSNVYNIPGLDPGTPTTKNGYRYNIQIQKVSGKVQFSLTHRVMDNKFDINDLGLNLTTSEVTNIASVTHNIFQPIGIIRDMNTVLSYSNTSHYQTGMTTTNQLRLDNETTFINYLTFGGYVLKDISDLYDYYEPRTAGRYYIRPGLMTEHFGISSDYRKPFALDMFLSFTTNRDGLLDRWITISPILRISDKLLINHALTLENITNDKGFVSSDNQSIYFGRRNITSVENAFTGKYLFRNNLSLNVWIRHYWMKGIYNKYYTLENDGRLNVNDTYSTNNNFNFNSFNVDLTFNWEFAPGSNLSMVWKNAITTQDSEIMRDYLHNFRETLDAPQLNSLSLRLLYYLDYQNLKNRFQKHPFRG